MIFPCSLGKLPTPQWGCRNLGREAGVVSEAAVAKHIGSLLAKLDLPPDADGHRRVLAVLAYLRN